MRVNFAIKGAARNKDSKSKLDPLAAMHAHVQKLSFLSNTRGDETHLDVIEMDVLKFIRATTINRVAFITGCLLSVSRTVTSLDDRD